MNEKSKTNSFENAPPPLCDWCGIPLGSANRFQQTVCTRCYKLLVNANLSDDEIFGSRSRQDRKKPVPQ